MMARKPKAPEGAWWTRAQAARYCGVSAKTTYGKAWKGFPATRINPRCTRFQPAAVEAWLIARNKRRAR